ncbi:MAG TPA: alpha/beta fold hydrolase [Stellaceae bacterium]|nr:alpha/beta fold hydrolase [Stellaceae bacterium]
MPRISIGDCHLYYERHGGGFPVVFVTGLSGYAAYWREQIPAFAKEFEVVVHDHRGVGQSDHSQISYTVERLAADVIGLMDALGIKKAHVVGHSTGGAIAQILAIEHPHRLASIVISASWTKADAYFRRLFTLRKEILQRLGPAAYLQSSTLLLYPPFWVAQNNEKLRTLEAQYLSTFSSPEIVTSRIDAILAFDRSAELGRIRTPALVLGAQDDAVTPIYFSEELARLIPGAEVKIFPQGGHAFTQIAARDFNNAVLPFLKAHTPARA